MTRRSEALVAQVALERHVSLEEGSCVAELPSGGVRIAKEGGGNHLDWAITEGARDGEGLLPECDGPAVVATAQALDDHESGDPREPTLIAISVLYGAVATVVGVRAVVPSLLLRGAAVLFLVLVVVGATVQIIDYRRAREFVIPPSAGGLPPREALPQQPQQ